MHSHDEYYNFYNNKLSNHISIILVQYLVQICFWVCSNFEENNANNYHLLDDTKGIG